MPALHPAACRRRGRRRRASATLAALATLVTTLVAGWPGMAQEQVGLDTAEAIDLDLPAEEAERAPATDWDVRVGAFVAVGPDYLGADRYEVDGVPYLRINWRDRIYLRGRSLEAALINTGDLRVGPLLRTRGGRGEDNDAILDGLGDVDRAWEAGGFVNYRLGPLRFRINGTQDFAQAHHGYVIDASAAVKLPLESPWFTLRVSGRWTDDDYNDTFFGIRPAQARRSRLPQYDADGGFSEFSVGLATRVPIRGGFSAVASLRYTRLLGDVADSPLVERHGNENQYLGAVGVVYDF